MRSKVSPLLWPEWQGGGGRSKPNYLCQDPSCGCPTRKNHIPCHERSSVIVPSWNAPPFFFDKLTQGKNRFSWALSLARQAPRPVFGGFVVLTAPNNCANRTLQPKAVHEMQDFEVLGFWMQGKNRLKPSTGGSYPVGFCPGWLKKRSTVHGFDQKIAKI